MKNRKILMLLTAVVSLGSVAHADQRCSGMENGRTEDLFVIYNKGQNIQMLSGGTEYMFLEKTKTRTYENGHTTVQISSDKTKVLISTPVGQSEYTNFECVGTDE